MPSAYQERENEKNSGSQRDIASVMATLANRQPGTAGSRQLTGPERAAVLMLALGEAHGAKVWSLLDDDELRELSIVMSTLGTVDAGAVEALLLEFVSRMSASGALMGTYDATERLLHQYLPPERVGGIMEEVRGARRPQHVGEALQRPGRGARQLSQERISADHRGGAVEDPPRACGAGARDPARGPRARRGHPYAQDGGGAEGGDRAGREHAAHRV